MRPAPVLLFFLALVLAPWVHADPLPAAARAEIGTLLARLQTSGCMFYRNGTWHDAAEARSHLLRKLEYLERRHAVHSTEQFIERAASGSSVSGRPYRVKCGDAAPVESQVWLNSELRSIRAAAAARTGPAR